MNNTENPFESVGLSLEQEIEKEKQFATQLILADNANEANHIMEDYKVFVENSVHGRTPEMILTCLECADYNGANIDNTIVIATVQDLFPILYRNIGLEKEQVTIEQLQKLAKNVDKKMNNEYLHNISKIELAKALFKLCALVNGKNG
jgi:hypothetical protein